MKINAEIVQVEEQDLFQNQDGGSIPTSPLQFRVQYTNVDSIRKFIEKYHYSGSINGCDSQYAFMLTYGNKIYGAMFYGQMAMRGQYKRFSNKIEDVIELRRLCCVDETPKNTESFFISKSILWIKKNTDIKKIVSYADEEYGHTGIIYKASNFKLEGFRKGADVILFNGKKYHDHAARCKYKGALKPFAVRLKQALDTGIAIKVRTAGKYCYTYAIKR